MGILDLLCIVTIRTLLDGAVIPAFFKESLKKLLVFGVQTSAFPDWYAITLLNEVIVPCALDCSL